MLIYLVRHAIAEERDPLGRRDDGARRLTQRGIDRMKQNVKALAALDVQLSAIWTSPLVRAHETAVLLRPLLTHQHDPEIVEALAGTGDHAAIVRRLRRTDAGDGIALVGHEPDMGELASVLLFGESEGGLRFKKGGVACIEVDVEYEPASGVLHWFLTPKQMRAML